ncbi:MAG: hypothetical protein HKN34_03585 [Gammaproteobacteria bacterium]|nr:hypothetical protein [Gammaproteobacteria bacterium]
MENNQHSPDDLIPDVDEINPGITEVIECYAQFKGAKDCRVLADGVINCRILKA